MTSQPVHTENISPKVRFQQSGTRLSSHRDMVASDIFKQAIDAALLQYQAELGTQTRDGNSAMAAGFRLLGAQEFVTELRKLADTTPIIRNVINDNLRAQWVMDDTRDPATQLAYDLYPSSARPVNPGTTNLACATTPELIDELKKRSNPAEDPPAQTPPPKP